MVEISAAMVKELRGATGSGIMDCKRVLAEAEGDYETAVDLLRKKGLAKAAKRAGRSTSEGLIYSYIHTGSKLGVLVEVNCESDFVAKTDDFSEFASKICTRYTPKYQNNQYKIFHLNRSRGVFLMYSL